MQDFKNIKASIKAQKTAERLCFGIVSLVGISASIISWGAYIALAYLNNVN